MKTADFDFALPEHLLAVRPADQRDRSRLLVLHRDDSCDHRTFRDIDDYLNPGDLLILNTTKVFPARLVGRKPGGGKLDLLLIRPREDATVWEVLYRTRYLGPVAIDAFRAELFETAGTDDSRPVRCLRFLDLHAEAIEAMLWKHGAMPLPPYIKREPDEHDKVRYQTVYAKTSGSIAAPTAGLHFTHELLDHLRNKGVQIGELTLHVGIGTFLPVKAERLADHAMLPEQFSIADSLFETIRRTKERGGRVIPVGTTATRALEGVASGRYHEVRHAEGILHGSTDIFIHPGHRFLIADGLVTNFHLPRSTPLMLVSALRGWDAIYKAYNKAIAIGYRFFSYGDAMLIL